MILSIASGKGGTGKTSVAVNLALSLENVQLLDCDVEEPNIHLLLNPDIQRKEPVYTLVPFVDNSCDHCGACSNFCQYNAIFVGPDKTLVFPELCHSCGGCSLVCPKQAVTYEKDRIGTIKYCSTEDLELIYGELEIGKPLAVPVIKNVKKNIKKRKIVILDSPPGASCPFVETVKGSNFCILVTEPTPFGLHDLKIAVRVLRQMAIPFGVIVNRANLGDKKVYDFCKEENISILLEIPFDRKIAELYSNGVPFSIEMPEWKDKFQALFNKVRLIVEK